MSVEKRFRKKAMEAGISVEIDFLDVQIADIKALVGKSFLKITNDDLSRTTEDRYM